MEVDRAQQGRASGEDERRERGGSGLSRVESVEHKAASVPLMERVRNLSRQDGLGTGWLFAAFLLAALAIVSRCPSMFKHAQFYAEDGTDWFAEAYNAGWLRSLTFPYMGYLSTVQRLGAGLAMLVSF